MLRHKQTKSDRISVKGRFPQETSFFPLAFLTALCQYIDMECIYCGKKTKVTNSRPQKKDHQTWRRRECTSCHATITSVEGFDLSTALRVEKLSGKYEPFERDKLFLSIYQSIDHLPSAALSAKSLTATVLRHITKTKPLDPVVSSSKIAQQTAMVLKRFNAAASVRYLSFQTNLQLANDVRRSLKR